jgi:hypothetical protein
MARYENLAIIGNPKVRIVVSAHINDDPRRQQATYCCLHSLLCQTYQNFDIIIAHDGPLNDETVISKINSLSDKITLLNNLPKVGNAGFQHRHPAAMMHPVCDWVLFTNEDNYYTPDFLKIMLHHGTTKNSGLVLCNMVHSYFDWGLLKTAPAVNQIDMGAFISRMDLVASTPWTDFGGPADGIYCEAIAAKTTPVKVDGILFVHN